MTPNTRKRKSRMANDLAEYIQELNLSTEDSVDVISLALRKLSLADKIAFNRKPTKSGRKLTSLETREAIWEFWHTNSVQSTITSRPATLIKLWFDRIAKT